MRAAIYARYSTDLHSQPSIGDQVDPGHGTYAIELVGELAGILALRSSQKKQSRPRAACSTVMVAGVGFEPTTFRL